MPELAEGRSDEELIAAWRGGDEGAAAELVRRHARPLARYLGGAGARDDVDDIVQETFFRAFRKIETYRGQASFRTWLVTIGSNVLKDMRRREVRRPVTSLEDRDVVDEKGDPYGETVERDLLARVAEAVRKLPSMQRDVFLLRAQQGIQYAEIAAALNTSEGAARVHYHHAVRRLKRVLEE